MIKVGITGGIGAGKSLVCSVIEQLGFPVFYSDIVAKSLIETDQEIRFFLESKLGEIIFDHSILNKPLLAKHLFSDKKLLSELNSIAHPKVRFLFDVWAFEQKNHIVFNEAAILFETGAYKNFDKIILITAPLSIRIERVVKRDATTEAQVQMRIDNQWSDERKIPLASFVVLNDDVTGLLSQIEKVIEYLNA